MPAVMLLLFALTIFLSAALLFLLELMVGKLMLPLLGGTPAVWNTCMVFYQAVLLAGYYYAHATTKYLGPRRQAGLHLVVLVLPLIFFAVTGPVAIQGWLVQGREGNPIFAALLVLTVSIGIPMFVICTSASMLTRWFSATDHPAAEDPYFLYAASNAGSLIGLFSYPFLFEPALPLSHQRLYWGVGFGLLALLTAGCAFLMWSSNPRRPADTGPNPKPLPPSDHVTDRPTSDTSATTPAVGKPVTWLRRLKWVALAAVPSSLMLGATTYMSMDIAAIPLLWVFPLALYLLTFIFVFSVYSVRTQNLVIVIAVWLALAGLGLLVAPTYMKEGVTGFVLGWTGFNLEPYISAKWFEEGSSILWLIRVGILGAAVWAGWIFTLKDRELIHHVMVMVMPLLVLLVMFLMLAEIGNVWVKIFMHLLTLFIVAMVCHGEMARDRPEPEHLTEFFLLMSIGGVVGGLFNALVAPLTFNAIIEYQLMLMVACLLVPPLGLSKDSQLARVADLALGAVFFIIGGLLVLLFYLNISRTDMPETRDMPWDHWQRGLVALVPGLLFGVIAAWQGWGTPPAEEGETPQNNPIDRLMDVLLPVGLFLLVLGLFWGLPTKPVEGRLKTFAGILGLEYDQFRNILTFGLPAVLCYTFVERSVRFGLGVGAILLAAGMSQAIREGALYQERSFFGVLKVESSYARYPEDRNIQIDHQPIYYRVNRLVHGTTLHGKQFLDPELRGLPSSYYHATGPVGQVMRWYNHDPNRAIAVIGLGTGTVATYGLKGQTLDYYDIDAVVMDIAYDTKRFFTYAEDAEDRGVDINMILGDARLTLDPNNPINRAPDPEKRGVPRLKPLRKVWDEEKREWERPLPQRRYGTPMGAEHKYGLIFADAFSSDAIPVHLLTREAIEIYLRRLHSDGIICVHISNRYLDLQPVLANIVEDLRQNGVWERDASGRAVKKLEDVPNLIGYHMSDDDELAPGKSRSHWIAISRDRKHLEKLWNVPLWHNDEGQLASLGLAMFPSHGPAMTSGSGLALACRAISEQVSRRALTEEGRSISPPLSVSKWRPLDTLYDMDERHAADEKELERVNAILGPLETEEERLDKEVKALDEAIKGPGAELEATQQQMDLLEKQLKAGLGDRSDLTRKLDEARRKSKELEAKLKELLEKKEAVASQKRWVSDRRQTLATPVYRLKSRIRNLEKRRVDTKKVGVWTDDYSNLLSVFNR